MLLLIQDFQMFYSWYALYDKSPGTIILSQLQSLVAAADVVSSVTRKAFIHLFNVKVIVKDRCDMDPFLYFICGLPLSPYTLTF